MHQQKKQMRLWKENSSIYKLNCTGLRFYCYGPYGRPDMSPLFFQINIKKKNIYLNNNGNHSRLHMLKM